MPRALLRRRNNDHWASPVVDDLRGDGAKEQPEKATPPAGADNKKCRAFGSFE